MFRKMAGSDIESRAQGSACIARVRTIAEVVRCEAVERASKPPAWQAFPGQSGQIGLGRPVVSCQSSRSPSLFSLASDT